MKRHSCSRLVVIVVVVVVVTCGMLFLFYTIGIKCTCCLVAPVLIRTSPRVVAIPAGSAAQLICQGQGRPRPEVTWLKDGVELVPGLHDILLIRG